MGHHKPEPRQTQRTPVPGCRWEVQASKRELGLEHLVAFDAPIRDSANGDHVATEDRRRSQRGNDVESKR